jgi:hypothetical protein
MAGIRDLHGLAGLGGLAGGQRCGSDGKSGKKVSALHEASVLLRGMNAEG